MSVMTYGILAFTYSVKRLPQGVESLMPNVHPPEDVHRLGVELLQVLVQSFFIFKLLLLFAGSSAHSVCM